MCEQKASYKTNDNKAFGCKQKLLEVPWCMRKGMLLKIKIAAKKKSVEEDICIVAIVC